MFASSATQSTSPAIECVSYGFFNGSALGYLLPCPSCFSTSPSRASLVHIGTFTLSSPSFPSVLTPLDRVTQLLDWPLGLALGPYKIQLPVSAPCQLSVCQTAEVIF